MQIKKYVSLAAISFIAISLMAALPAFAQTNPPGAQNGGRFGRGMMGKGQAPAVFGTVATNNGSTLTITSKARPKGSDANATATSVTYTVSTTSSTTVTKNGATSSVSAILVGDTVIIQGTVSGTNVAATIIRDGMMQRPQQTPAIQGNGQPVVAGSVASISGNVINITNKSNVSYAVNTDPSNTKFVVPGVTSPTISNIAVGDNLVVQGTVNGNSVAASSVIDQKPKTNNTASANQKPNSGFMGGIFGGIGNFFQHLFGF